MPKISVIVPVYNTSNFLKDCLESLFNQTYKDYEIIIVNDGSTDNSEGIILDLVNGKRNCKYIYQQNGGLSAARNTGMAFATGEYIAFVDSDDWVEENYLEIMLTEIEKYNADICECGYYRKKDNKILSIISPENKFTYISDENQLINLYYRTFIQAKYGIISWNKLYKKDFIDNLELKFEQNDEIYAEDLLFNTKLILYTQKVVEVSSPLYNYRIRHGSITQNYKPLLEQRYAELMKRIEQICKERIPKTYPEFIALMQYESLNVITANSYFKSKCLNDIYRSLNIYDKYEGKIFYRLEHINSARLKLSYIRKDFDKFFKILNFVIKIRKKLVLSILFWLKFFIINDFLKKEKINEE